MENKELIATEMENKELIATEMENKELIATEMENSKSSTLLRAIPTTSFVFFYWVLTYLTLLASYNAMGEFLELYQPTQDISIELIQQYKYDRFGRAPGECLTDDELRRLAIDMEQWTRYRTFNSIWLQLIVFGVATLTLSLLVLSTLHGKPV
jgi:hypothetical protein